MLQNRRELCLRTTLKADVAPDAYCIHKLNYVSKKFEPKREFYVSFPDS
jgi:hypothetical protein